MYIGLVRHFKVDCNAQAFMTSNDFEKWVIEYDNSSVMANEFETKNIEWDKCFSSDLSRAIKTSETIFKGEIIKTQLLREVPLSPICKTNFKLPHRFWCIAARMAWMFHHKSQAETKKDTEGRINEFLNSLDKELDTNILIVCHGFFMKNLERGLKRRGFSGQNISIPENGTLYLYKK
ncbi:phosphoglycerate mutase family protein [uncultured Clostridium sp.]|uniref:phosphoglycerate mutase family protein n=1 Tax=uncultured Clostridium sp. TaxID=59620 RepID=UPI0028E4056E|nr:phosphoglycerate mutase family protein [uncultured Clostridium sp.]